jgi:hypothetical protein
VVYRGFDLLGRTVDSIRSEADLALAQVNTATTAIIAFLLLQQYYCCYHYC